MDRLSSLQYAGSYPERLQPVGGYSDFECKFNPFSNKIVLMDEVGAHALRLHCKAALSLRRASSHRAR